MTDPMAALRELGALLATRADAELMLKFLDLHDALRAALSGPLTPSAERHVTLQHQKYLSVPEAAEYLRFATPGSFWDWAKRHGLPTCKAGRLNLYRRTDLEERVERTAPLQVDTTALPTRLVQRKPRGPTPSR